MQPTFHIIGVIKGGTTSLFWHLKKHPSICATINKELSIVSDECWNGSQLTEKAADELPRSYNYKGEKHIMLVSPYAIRHPEAPRRFKSFMPDAPMICSLRDPIGRTYSHWNMLMRYRLRSVDGVVSFRSFFKQRRAVRELGLYHEQLKRWLDLFPKEQIKFITQETLRSEHFHTYSAIYDFLGISGLIPEQNFPFDGSYDKPIHPKTVRELADFYYDDVMRTQELTGLDLSHWKTVKVKQR